MAENPYSITPQLSAGITRVQNIALGIGGVFTLLTIIQLFLDPAQFFRSWLIGFLLPFGLSLGALACLMLQYMTGGGWGMLVRRQLEAGSRTIPFVLILFIPICFGLPHLYQWTNSTTMQSTPELRDKAHYLNVTWWLIRAAIVFGIWLIYQYKLNSLSAEEERTGSLQVSKQLMGWSGIGLVLYALTLTSAGVDWLMSLNVTWYSTIYGLILLGGQGLAIVSLVLITTTLLMRQAPLSGVVQKRHLHDLGKLLFMFTLFWTYVNFGQLLIIWAGNLPDEITWYVARMNGGFGWMASFLLFFQWMLPFLILLSQDVKRNPKAIRFMACWVIVVRMVDMIWQVEPSFHPTSFFVSWSDITAILGLTGLWVGLYMWELKKRPLIAINAPDLQRYLEYVPAK
jgi:hypothetical protein